MGYSTFLLDLDHTLFDTDASEELALVDALVTERGVVLLPNAEKIKRLMGEEARHRPLFDTTDEA